MIKVLVIAAVLLIAAYIGLRLAIHYFSSAPATIGLTQGQLQPCPDSPNCVMSNSRQQDKRVDAMAIQISPAEAINTIGNVIRSLPNTAIVTQRDNYLHATFKTKMMGYIDDLEVLHVPGSTDIEIRSASRLGQSDLGANRKRVEMLREQLVGKI